MKSVLVAGGAGYIGSHTGKALFDAGLRPVVLDDLSTGHRSAVHWGPFIAGDIGDRPLVRKTVERYGVEAVVHLAANACVGESMENPRKYFHGNVTKTLTLLDAALDCGVRQIVYSSTCAVYGHPHRLPIDETHPEAPVNPYGESKLFVEKALRWYGDAYDLRFVSLRYFNAAGADPEGETGEDHVPETHLVPLAIQAARRITPELAVFGTDYPTGDGTAVRDYVHVTDLAMAHVAALSHLAAGRPSACLNLGTGAGHSVRKVVQAVESVSGCAIPISPRKRRPGDPATLIACAGRASRILDWTPRFTDLNEIVGTAWAWHTSSRRWAAASGSCRGGAA